MSTSFNGDEWLTIVRRLADLTRRGLLTWQQDENAPGPGAFRAVAPNETMYLLYPTDFDGRFPYILSIWEGRVNEVGSFKTTAYDDTHFESSEEAVSAAIVDIYASVARLVSGAPQKLKSLLSELSLLDPNEGDQQS